MVTRPLIFVQKNVVLSNEVKKRTSELKHAMQALSDERDHLAHVVNALPGLLLFSGSDLREFNVFDHSIDQKRNFQGVFTYFEVKKNQEELLKKLRKVAFGLQEYETGLVEYILNDGDKELAFLCTVTRDKRGHIIYVQDYTEWFYQEKLIQEQEASIAYSSKLAAIGEIAAGIAHEINNPLTIIASSAWVLSNEMKKEDVKSENMDEAISDIRSTVERISKIISGMRTLTRNNSEGLDIQAFDLGSLLSDIMALCRSKINSNSITVDLEFDKNSLISCDHVQFSQVLINLLNNSFDALENADTKIVKISHHIENEWDVIYVEDSGPGITREHLDQIFNPFYTTKKFGKGTGLGLSISRRIMESQGGSIDYDLNSEQTRFVLRLPRKTSE